MQKIFMYRKIIGLTVLMSTFLLCIFQSTLPAAMIPTEAAMHPDSKLLADRVRIKSFLSRADVLAQLQAHGISAAEARKRVDSLTDHDITLLAGKLDQIPHKAGGTFTADGSFLFFLGVALYAIIAAIVIWFGFSDQKEEKP